MNTRPVITTAIIVMLLCFSCSKDFLDEVPKASLDLESFYKTSTDAEIGLTGAYAKIISKHMMQNIFWLTVSADEITAGNHAKSGIGAGDNRDLATSELYGMLGTYTEPYVGICNINLLLKKVQEIPENSFRPGRKTEILGEAYFLRGYAYYMLAMVFRDVPIVFEVPTSSDPKDNYIGKSSQEQVLNQAKSDFKMAASLLPDRLDSQTDHDVRGRGSKWAAKGFMARIHMWNENWDSAYQQCNEIINSNMFVFSPKWTDIFAGENDNDEVIWQSQGQSRAEYDFMGVYRWYCDADPTAPLPPFMVEKGMMNMFGGVYKDVRLEYSVRQIGRSTGESNYGGRNVKHFHVPSGLIIEGQSDESRDKNFPLIRLAEIMLMRDEAIVQSGYSLGTAEDVLSDLNAIRARAADPSYVPREEDPRYTGTGGCTGIPALTIEQVNLKAIQDEKKRELMFEGVRYIDLLRWGREDDFVSLMEIVHAPNVDRLYAAIPQSQINVNKGVLVQNPGY